MPILTEVLKREPQNVRAMADLGYVYILLNDFDKALGLYNAALAIDPKARGVRFDRYHCFRFRKEYDRALEEIASLIAEYPEDGAYLVARSRTYCDQGKYAEALKDVDRAEEMKVNAVECARVRGELFLAAGAYPEATEEFNRWVSKAPRSKDAFWLRGQAAACSGRYREALADYAEVLRIAPSDSKCLCATAWILATCSEESLRDGVRALELAGKACENTSWKKAEAIDALAAASARTGDFEKAIQWEERATGLESSAEAREAYRERRSLYEKGQAYEAPLKDKQRVEWGAKRSECFQVVWQTVNDNYFDPTFGGVDWVAIREKYRRTLWQIGDNRALRRMLQDMLDELHRTHFEIVPREMSVLNPEERGKIGYTGAEATVVDEAVTILRVKADSPADKAGIKPGDVVKGVDGHTLVEVEKTMSESVADPRKRKLFLRGLVNWWLSAPVGTAVKLSLENSGGEMREVTVKTESFAGIWSEAVGFSPSEPMNIVIERKADGVVYMRFNLFALPAMKEFKQCVRSLRKGEGLIIDLRGNPGGLTIMAPGMFGRLSENRFSLGTMHRRDGQDEFVAYPQKGAFLGPVAVLTDAASASTSEILAAGLKEAGRARLFGEATAGAALPSTFRKLPTGDMLQYAVADVKTPHGILLEGAGVAPDESVAMHRADCATGRDPVRAAAERWITSQLKPASTREAAEK